MQDYLAASCVVPGRKKPVGRRDVATLIRIFSFVNERWDEKAAMRCCVKIANA